MSKMKRIWGFIVCFVLLLVASSVFMACNADFDNKEGRKYDIKFIEYNYETKEWETIKTIQTAGNEEIEIPVMPDKSEDAPFYGFVEASGELGDTEAPILTKDTFKNQTLTISKSYKPIYGKYLKFYDIDGEEIAKTPHHGKRKIKFPEVEILEGNEFLSWKNNSSSNVTEDFFVNAERDDDFDYQIYANYKFMNSEGVRFELTADKKGYIVSRSSYPTSENVYIHDTYKKLPVVEIAAFAFQFNPDNSTVLKSVRIPKSVKTLRTSVFSNQKFLESVSGAEGLEVVEYGAFEGTKLIGTQGAVYVGSVLLKYNEPTVPVSTISIKETTKVIASDAFEENKTITSLALPEGVKFIGSNAFKGSVIETINLSNV